MSNTTPESGKEIHDGSTPETNQAPAETSTSAGDTAVAPTVEPANADREIVIDYGSAVDPDYVDPDADATADAQPTSETKHEHGHSDVADKAYAEQPDTHTISSAEPTVLTQADLREDEVHAAEAGTGAIPAEQTAAQRAAAERAEADRADEEAKRTAAIRADAESSRTDHTSTVGDTAVAPTVAPAAPTRQPIYVQAPSKPKPKSNRGFGIAVSLLATGVFAVLYAGILALILAANNGSVDVLDEVLARAPYWIPVIFFFLAMALLVTIVNRGGWWAYVLGGFAVAAIVYGSYLGGVLIDQANNIAPSQIAETVGGSLLAPAAIISFLVAREVPIWFGAWIASRGRKVRERNAEAQAEYERVLEQGPVVA